MTEKQYTVHFDETLGNQIWKDGKPFACVDARHQANKVCIELNELNDENQVLRESLKNQYMNEICETCKFGQYDMDWYGEGEFECLKGHNAVECDGKTECEDFELDLEWFLE